MLILPAIDLMDGVCVRLNQGKFDDATAYGDPREQLQAFAAKGAEWVHIVDLDGARQGRPVQHAALRTLVCEVGVKIQCGGGVRQWAHVQGLLDAGVSRVVVGSVAVQRPDEVRHWIESFGAERICCAFDVRPADGDWEVVIKGWTQDGGRSLLQALALYPEGLLRHVLVTDISRDGMLGGANRELITLLRKARPDLAVQASGGVATLADLEALRAAGASAAIVGRALYERRLTLEDALAL